MEEPQSSEPPIPAAHALQKGEKASEKSEPEGLERPGSTFATHLSIYTTYRDYVKHEDDLINNRLNWNLTIQGFLFAAYSFSLQKVADVKVQLLANTNFTTTSNGIMHDQATIRKLADALSSASGANELRFVVTIVAAVGLMVSLLVYRSVFAAREAIHRLEIKWRKDYDIYDPEKNPGLEHTYLPGLTGGGSVKALKAGFSAPLLLPLVFVGAWWCLLVYAVLDYFG